MEWYSVLGIVSSILAVLGAATAFLRWLIIHEIQGLSHQLEPNGGSSFRDHMDRRLDEVQTHLRSQDRRTNGIDGRLDGIDGRLDGIDGRLNAAETAARRREGR